MKSPKTLQKNILSNLTELYPEVRFVESDSFYWSPKEHTVYYDQSQMTTEQGVFALIHETGHAALGHTVYSYDYELLKLEIMAWRKAEEIARLLDIIIEDDHIQQCLDTYRDWLSDRSVCPRCGITSLQAAPGEYVCHNCNNSWTVTASLFCRPYRMTKKN